MMERLVETAAGFVVANKDGKWREEWRTSWWCFTIHRELAQAKANELNKLDSMNAPFAVRAATVEIKE